MIHIYGATRGNYGNPIPILESDINWIDEEYLKTSPPKTCKCDHPKHWEWGRGTRNGQKLWYLTNEMFCQKWILTKKQMHEAVNQYDMASLEMPTIIICKHCAEKELALRKSSKE